ncbi:IS200/IS605 family transposase [Limosilactobacillus reuteri]|uniref:IS200/IS605 family transposase n=1 Tax=Limosilactobacillus reuteri TaxID=1598 RepID=UPI001E5EA8CB|nr:IS200/IS605 family transposase [Limosilactobacillus reuteri]
MIVNYHLVMVVKYRRKVINDEISEYLKHRFVVVGQAYGINLQEWNYDQDHVHVLFRATPHTRARSTGYGEGKGMSVTIQDLVLDRNNLNQAYLRVKRNKGAAGIDDMTVNDLLPYLRENICSCGTSIRH